MSLAHGHYLHFRTNFTFSFLKTQFVGTEIKTGVFCILKRPYERSLIFDWQKFEARPELIN